MVDAIPLSLQATYRDLLDRHARRPSPEVEGSVLKVENKDNPYWVVRHRIGNSVTERRIGPDADPAAQERAERLRRENQVLQAWARDAAGLVAQLRAARMPTPTTGTGKLINALSRAGLFRSGGILAGTHAFGLYALELGVRLRDTLVLTEDVDIAAARSIRVIMDDGANLTTSLAGIGLRPIAGPGQPHPVRWETTDGVALDALTPRRRGSEAVVPLEGLGIWAQALAYLEFSLVEPVDAVVLYREGIHVRIPAPERYAIHKLITASVRTGTHRAKVEKDLEQAESLIEVLTEARPYELAGALDDARSRGRKWREALDASLARRPEVAGMLKGV